MYIHVHMHNIIRTCTGQSKARQASSTIHVFMLDTYSQVKPHTCILGEEREGLTGVPGCTGEAPAISGPVGRVPGRDGVEKGDTGGSGSTEGVTDSKLMVKRAQPHNCYSGQVNNTRILYMYITRTMYIVHMHCCTCTIIISQNSLVYQVGTVVVLLSEWVILTQLAELP